MLFRSGWETANKYVRYEIDPDALAFAADAVDDSGTFWNASADDWRRLREVELAHGAGTSLTLRRSRQWWHHRVFERFGDERYVYAWDDEHGETAGYLVYTVDGDHGDRTLEVAEASYRSEKAYLQLLGFLYRHDSQVSEIELYRCCGTDMLDRVADTTDIECEIDAGPMIRVADVPAALERVPYPDGVSGSTTIAVTDPLLEAGNGTVRLDVEDGEAECRPAPDAGQADVETGVGTLSQLVVGYHDVQDAERLGSLSCADDEVRETFDRLFPPETVCLRDFF